MRGRVMALYAIAFLGSTPIGGPLIGWISQQYGARFGFAIGGVATVVATAFAGWSLVRHARARVAGPESSPPAPPERLARRYCS